MKWKILGRFLIILIVSTLIVLGLSMFVISDLLFSDFGPEGERNYSAGFTLDFAEYIVEEDGRPQVTAEGIAELKSRQAWIQILDEHGYEVYHWNKPEQALTHYTPSESVFYNIYSGAIDDYTVFTGTAAVGGKKWSYLIGFPMEKVSKYIYIYSPGILMDNITEVFILLLIIPVVVFVVMGYVFGRSLTKPVIEIVEGIQRLARGEYDKSYQEKGLYSEVYRSLNHLAQILKRNEIERKNIEEMREEWIANLSHDLKTPLASIKGYGELMADDDYALTAEEVRHYARIIQDKANYMEKLVEDLKLTQGLKHGLIPLNRRPGNLVDFLREIVIDVLNNPRYEQRTIHFLPQAEEIVFAFDHSLLKRAFANLIFNAIVHNAEDTEITIKVETALCKAETAAPQAESMASKVENNAFLAEVPEPGVLSSRTNPADDGNELPAIRVTIEDNGQGISEEDLGKLFERYYRGTNTGESHKGAGLGMAIARQVIELHGGKIEVESALGAGTKITVTF